MSKANKTGAEPAGYSDYSIAAASSAGRSPSPNAMIGSSYRQQLHGDRDSTEDTPLIVTTSSNAGSAAAPQSDSSGGTAKKVSFALFAIYVLTTLLNRVSNTIQYSFTPYALFVNLYWTATGVPILWFMSWYRRKSHPITPEEKAIKWYVWWTIAGLWGVSSTLNAIASAHLAGYGALQVLLSKTAIPMSLAITKILLPKTKYEYYHYGGSLLVLFSILVIVLPDMLTQDGAGASLLARWPWILLYVTGYAPSVLVNVYMEKMLSDTTVDELYLMAKCQGPQLILTLILLIPSAMIENIQPQDLGDKLLRGAQCQFGITPDGDASCTLAPVFTHLFILLNTGWNVANIFFLAVAGANTNIIAATLVTPLALIVFALPFMPSFKPVTGYTFLGLLLNMTGIAIYRSWPELKAEIRGGFPTVKSYLGHYLACRPLLAPKQKLRMSPTIGSSPEPSTGIDDLSPRSNSHSHDVSSARAATLEVGFARVHGADIDGLPASSNSASATAAGTSIELKFKNKR